MKMSKTRENGEIDKLKEDVCKMLDGASDESLANVIHAVIMALSPAFEGELGKKRAIICTTIIDSHVVTTTALGNTMLGMYGLAFTADNIGKKVGKSVQDILMDSYLAYSIGSERPIKEESDSSH